MSVERETQPQHGDGSQSPQVEDSNSSIPHRHSSSRLSAQATPWYPLQRVRDSASSQPRREDEFPGTPVEMVPPDGGVSPVVRAGPAQELPANSLPRHAPTTPSSSSSQMASPVLASSGTRPYATDADDNVVLVPFRGYETEDEIIRGLAGDGYWWTPNNMMTAQQCHELYQQQEIALQHQNILERRRKKKLRKTRAAGMEAGNVGDDDDEDLGAEEFGDEEESDDERGEEGPGGYEGWEDDPDAYADEWDSLDEDEQAWIEEQMRPQDNPDGFF